MRAAIVLLPVIGAVFLGGLACGLLLRAPTGPPVRVHLPGVPGSGFDVRIPSRRRRSDANRPAAGAPEASAGNEGWDTYESGAESDESGEPE
jgi:hypothetical protein